MGCHHQQMGGMDCTGKEGGVGGERGGIPVLWTSCCDGENGDMYTMHGHEDGLTMFYTHTPTHIHT